LRTEASRVVLASVTDGSKAIVDLDADDFAITEDGSPREILTVYPADYPVVVLLDNGAEAGSDLPDIRRAAARFIERIGQRAIGLGTLSDPPAIIAGLGEDREVLFAKLAALEASPAQGLAPVRAVANAARAILQAQTPFGAVVAVSTRGPEVNEPEPMSLLSDVFERNVIIHVISRHPPGGVPSAEPVRVPSGGDVLRDLARQTRGEYTPVFSAASYLIALDRLADRMATEMMVEYLVPSGQALKADVRVGVRMPGARVRGLGVSK
jgi:hypothetical protein